MLGILFYLAFAPVLAVAPETFEVLSAADLVAICSTAPSDYNSSAAVGFCHGYVVGVYRTIAVIKDAKPSTRLICMPPKPVNRTEAIGSYVTWVSARPEELSKPPIESLASFLSSTYPCPASAIRAIPGPRRGAE